MKAKNNPRPTIDDLCEVCGRPYAHLHEVFFGTGQRQKSIEHGMQIRLCYEHHNDPSSKENPHFNAAVDNALKRAYQSVFEQRKMNEGLDPDQARDAFRTTFGRNYLD